MGCIADFDYTQMNIKKATQISKLKRSQINRKHEIAYVFLQTINTYCQQSVFAEIKGLQFHVIYISLPVAFYIWSFKGRTLINQ